MAIARHLAGDRHTRAEGNFGLANELHARERRLRSRLALPLPRRLAARLRHGLTALARRNLAAYHNPGRQLRRRRPFVRLPGNRAAARPVRPYVSGIDIELLGLAASIRVASRRV